MREGNAYHKFHGYGQKRIDSKSFENLRVKIEFNYYNDSGVTSEVKNMFKGLEFVASSTVIITEDKKGFEEEDRLWIDDSAGLISKIHTAEKQKLKGQRFANRKKVYVIEIEV